jgi:DNA-binding NtrC family response regulator
MELKNIIMIDDDSQYGELLTEILKDQGWKVQHFDSIFEFKAKNPDLNDYKVFICDYFLPESDGNKIINELQTKFENVNYALLTIKPHLISFDKTDFIPRVFDKLKINELLNYLSSLDQQDA